MAREMSTRAPPWSSEGLGPIATTDELVGVSASCHVPGRNAAVAVGPPSPPGFVAQGGVQRNAGSSVGVGRGTAGGRRRLPWRNRSPTCGQPARPCSYPLTGPSMTSAADEPEELLRRVREGDERAI